MQRENRASQNGRRAFCLARQCLSNPSIYLLVRELRRVLRGCNSILDVGCGSASPLRFISGPVLVGVDGHEPSFNAARLAATHDELRLGSVLELDRLFSGRKFDACVSLDVIEHLQKEDGWRMLRQMEGLATKRVVIFTPNGFVPQHSKDGDLQEHLSGWTATEMREKGFHVLGMYGPKSLRGEYHNISRSPKVFWLGISLLAHFACTRTKPEQSAAIFCEKVIA